MVTFNECIIGINNKVRVKKRDVLLNQVNTNKPFKSFGRLEGIGYKLSEIIGVNKNEIKTGIVVFAGDHGVSEMEVSVFSQGQTKRVVNLLGKGTMPLNKIVKNQNIQVKCYDVGINGKVEYNDIVVDMKIKNSTNNMIYKDAMPVKDVYSAIEVGIRVAEEWNNNKFNILAVGEIGISNTISASIITTILCDRKVDEVTDVGTGVSGEKLMLKKNIINELVEKYRQLKESPIELLAKVGGYEICSVIGTILGCAYYKIPIVIDGYITSAAALVAYKICPNIKPYIFASHISAEKGHKYIIDELNLMPIVDLKMKYGVATGAAIALPIYKMAYELTNI